MKIQGINGIMTINAKGDGNCSFRAIIQSLLLHGIVEAKKGNNAEKEFVIDFFNNLWVNRSGKHKTIKRLGLESKVNFQKFYEEYMLLQDNKDYDKFIEKYFDTFNAQNDAVIYLIAAYLRYDLYYYISEQELLNSKQDKKEIGQLDTSCSLNVMTVPKSGLDSFDAVINYFRNQGINIFIYGHGAGKIVSGEEIPGLRNIYVHFVEGHYRTYVPRHQHLALPVDVGDKDGYTPLMWTIYNKQGLKTVKEYSQSGANIFQTNRWNSNALHVACKHNQNEVVEYLINEHVKNPEQANMGNKDGYTPLMWVIYMSDLAEKKRLKLVKTLVEEKGADISQLNRWNKDALFVAKKYNRDNVVKYLSKR